MMPGMPGKLGRSARILLVCTIAAAGALVGVSPAAAWPGNAATRHRTIICKSNGSLIAHTRQAGTGYVVRNAYWLGQRPQCITNRGNLSNFRVVQRPGYDPAGRVVAYPDIFRGCIWNICSPQADLPRRVSALGRPRATWHTSEHATGTWNAAFDIWFGKKRMVTGQADGAELMIWLNEHGGCCALQQGAPKVLIDGQLWWLSHWTAHHNGKSWNYIQFRRVHRTWHVNNLKLYPFIRRIEHLGLVRPGWWIENIEAGFELWNGGRGLATTKYVVRAVSGRV
jgi:cellulose 1,4-beta-cellobiosidase